MMELTMFQKLQQLPLLQGLSSAEIQSLVSVVRLEFKQLDMEDTIVEQNDNCNKIIFVLSGTMRAEYHDVEGRYIFSETIEGPTVIEPYSLFGMMQRYTRSYISQTECSTITIDRQQFINVMMNINIVKTNMLNIVCNSLQQLNKKLHIIYPQEAEHKIAYFFYTCCIQNKGPKHIYIKMETLADIIGETRLKVSHALKLFREEGMLTAERKSFNIVDIQLFINKYLK